MTANDSLFPETGDALFALNNESDGQRAVRSASRKTTRNSVNGANLGFEEKLWAASDKMRGHMDPAEYKHVILGLIFLKFISDNFKKHHAYLNSQNGSDPEAPEVYKHGNSCWVPPDARWDTIQGTNATQLGEVIDRAMSLIEGENEAFRGILLKDYSRPTLDKRRLAQLVEIVGTLDLGGNNSGSQDIIGRVYEYFLSRFAGIEGNQGGEFYTPRSVVRLLVNMIEPYCGIVYDPCCGSAGMFVQSEEFIRQHGGRTGDIRIYGQESNHSTWRLAKMNLAVRGLNANLGQRSADTFFEDLHPELKADYILANPPFNMSYWGDERLNDDQRWEYGIPPMNSANFAWVQHIAFHLAPEGTAGFVLSNGTLTTNSTGEGNIRKAMIKADLIDCIVSLPSQLFYGTSIAACLWFLAKSKNGSKHRMRCGQTLFIDARGMGRLVDRTHRELSDEEIDRIACVYHMWRGLDNAESYKDVPGFCKGATIDEIESHRWALVPGRYVGFDHAERENISIAHLRQELEQVEERLLKVSHASHAALDVLKGLLNGSIFP